jgi:hypothetical protein
MSIINIIHNLRSPCANTFEKPSAQGTLQVCQSGAARCDFLGLVDIAQDVITSSAVEKEKGKNRNIFLDLLANFMELLFPHHTKETNRRLLGEEMPPVVIYTPAGCFFMADGNHRHLEPDRNAGKISIQADEWGYLSRFR